jgi:hypothetical protein
MIPLSDMFGHGVLGLGVRGGVCAYFGSAAAFREVVSCAEAQRHFSITLTMPNPL